MSPPRLRSTICSSAIRAIFPEASASAVALARAIVRDPAAFLMDEPLSNLDARLRLTMRGEIKRLCQRLGATTLYVTHDQVEALTMADLIAVMSAGELQQTGLAGRNLRAARQPLRGDLRRQSRL
jgi:ABC-type Fe3+/spermidine/putrescine transport system ATPase subunit